VTALIVGAVVVAVVVVAVVISSLGGSSGKSPSSTTSATHTTATHSHRPHTTTSAGSHASEPSTPSVGPAETQVAVLNGTSTVGLAHRLSASLQQSGYSQATALDGTPPGSRQTTTVEYASGHHAEAEQVARTLSVSAVAPMESSISPLVGGSTVVVIAGMDKAGSTGEASSGAAGGESVP